MIRLTSVLIVFFYFGTTDVLAQNASLPKRPEKGQLMPDFVFTDIDGQYGKKVKLSDFRGQHLILDFWAIGCASCVKGFPQMDSLDRAKKGDLKVILVGINHGDVKRIKEMYGRYRDSYNLQIMSVYDTIAARVMGVQGVPAVVWIDDKGVFKGLTSGLGTPTNTKNFLNNTSDIIDRGRSSYLSADSARLHVRHNPKTPLGINSNGVYEESDFTYRSVLYKWKEGMPSVTGGFVDLLDGRYVENTDIKSFNVELRGVEPSYLYIIAATGRSWFDEHDNFYPEFLFDVRNKERTEKIFRRSYEDIENVTDNLWSYSLIIPYERSKDASVVRRWMLNDLERYFGYTVIEQRLLMDCWVLKHDPSVKKPVKPLEYQRGTEIKYSIGVETGLLEMKGHRLEELLYRLEKHRIRFDSKNRLRNGTGLPNDFLVDIQLDLKVGKNNTIEDVNRELAKYGLKFVFEKSLLRVLTIKEI